MRTEFFANWIDRNHNLVRPLCKEETWKSKFPHFVCSLWPYIQLATPPIVTICCVFITKCCCLLCVHFKYQWPLMQGARCAFLVFMFYSFFAALNCITSRILPIIQRTEERFSYFQINIIQFATDNLFAIQFGSLLGSPFLEREKRNCKLFTHKISLRAIWWCFLCTEIYTEKVTDIKKGVKGSRNIYQVEPNNRNQKIKKW